MPLVKYMDYKVNATYYIEIKTSVGEIDFTKRERCKNLYDVLNLINVCKNNNLETIITRYIHFEKHNNNLSEEPPVIENLTVKEIEDFISKGEKLPKKQYSVPVTKQELDMLVIFEKNFELKQN